MADILPFTGLNYGEIDPLEILEANKKTDWDKMMVIGWTKDGSFAFASSTGEIAHMVLLLRRCERELMDLLASA